MECQFYGGLCTYGPGVSGIVDASGRLTLTAIAHRYIREYMDSKPDIDCSYEDCGFAFVRRGDYEDGYLVIAATARHFAEPAATAPSLRVEAAAPLPAVVNTPAHGEWLRPGQQRRVEPLPGLSTSGGRARRGELPEIGVGHC